MIYTEQKKEGNTMMRVTRTTFNMLQENRRKANKNTIKIQWMKKNGEWGKPYETAKYGKETDDEAIERLIKNNNRPCRIAE